MATPAAHGLALPSLIEACWVLRQLPPFVPVAGSELPLTSLKQVRSRATVSEVGPSLWALSHWLVSKG